MRVIAIDYGKTRVGIAITDPLGIIAQPLLTVPVKSQHALINRLKFIINENNVGLIIIGTPISHSGGATNMSREVEAFAKKLSKATKLEVKLWDERFTSRLAVKTLKDMGIKSRKTKLDQIVASMMLEEYLKSQAIHPA